MNFRKLLFAGFFFFTTVILPPSSLTAGTINLIWRAPQANADGTHLNDLAGFKVYIGLDSRDYFASVDVGYTTMYQLENMPEWLSFYFAVTAYDNSKNESGFSAEMVKKASVTGHSTGSSGTTGNSSAAPDADFTFSAVNGINALAVSFVNNSVSQNQPLIYEWDFDNDGIIDSTEQHPAYEYPASGLYAIKLKVTDSLGNSGFLIKTVYLNECGSPVQLAKSEVGYMSVGDAYDDAANGGTIQITDKIFIENLLFEQDKRIVLRAGYSCDYSASEGTTTVKGDFAIEDGIVVLLGGTLKMQ